MDAQGWYYDSKLHFMYKLVSAEASIPSREPGYSILQAEFRHVLFEFIGRFKADPKNCSPHTPSALGQYYVELALWKHFWGDEKFPGEYPEPPENEYVPVDQMSVYDSQGSALAPPKLQSNAQSTTSNSSESSEPTCQVLAAHKHSSQDASIFDGVTQSSTPEDSIPRGPQALNSSQDASIVDGFCRSSTPSRPIPTGPAAMRSTGKGAYAGNVTSLTSLPSKNADTTQHRVSRNEDTFSPNIPTKHAYSKYTRSEQPLPAPLKSGVQAAPTAPRRRLTAKQRAEVVRVILHRKGDGYIPKHGWDNFGLPMYSITCFANNGFFAFTGENQIYFNTISQAFPKFRVMYQKIWMGFLFIWLEHKGYQTSAMTAESELWEEFKECWAFLKSWANQQGEAVNIVEYMESYNGDAKTWAEAVHLTPPRYYY